MIFIKRLNRLKDQMQLNFAIFIRKYQNLHYKVFMIRNSILQIPAKTIKVYFKINFIIFSVKSATQKMAYVFKPQWVSEGKGAKVIRIIGNEHLQKMDPFLMLDFFSGKLPGGFPDHPHRGFQTVSYLLKGTFLHEDFKGHKGKLQAGDLQWMTAGRGIMHSEMPGSFQEESIGFQLWINLRKQLKMIEPQYQQYRSKELQIIQQEKSTVKIISGEWKDKKGPILARTPTYYFDISLEKNGDFQIPIPKKWNTLIFVYEGNLEYSAKGKTLKVGELNCCVLEKSDTEEILHKFKASQHSKFVLIGGQPLNEPIVQYGPFVMNTKEEIHQAFKDYREGKNGFEGSQQWQSKIKFLNQGMKIEDLL